MGFNWGGFGRGAMMGASTGSPWGVAAGGLLGLMGSKGPKLPGVDSVLPRINAFGEANKVMENTNVFDRQMGRVRGGAMDIGNTTREKMLASGVDPIFAARAGADAQYRALTEGADSVGDNASEMYTNLLSQYNQMAKQRETERASYGMYQHKLDPNRQMSQMMLNNLSNPEFMNGMGHSIFGERDEENNRYYGGLLGFLFNR